MNHRDFNYFPLREKDIHGQDIDMSEIIRGDGYPFYRLDTDIYATNKIVVKALKKAMR